MPKRRNYSVEFKREAVALANQPGVTKAQIGLVLFPIPNAIRFSSCISAGYDVGICAASRFSTAGSGAAS